MFEQQDYILRIIALAGAALRRALEQFQLGHASQALEYTDEAIGLVLDTDPKLVLRLTPEGLSAYLGIGTLLDDRRLMLLAQALESRARILEEMGRAEESELDARRAAAVRGLITAELQDDGEVWHLPDEDLPSPST